jgi:hypothetical protein
MAALAADLGVVQTAMGPALVTIAGPRLAAVLLVAVTCVGCCREEYSGQVASPDARYEVAVVERNCGATTGYLTYVRITDKRALLLRDRDLMMVEGSPDLRLSWVGPRQLLIEYPIGRRPNPDRTYGPTARWEDVDVTMRQSAP